MSKFPFMALACGVFVCIPAFSKTQPALDQLPAWFEPAPAGGAYVARSAEAQFVFTGPEARLSFAPGPGRPAAELTWRLVGAAASPKLEPEQPRPGRSNYFQGRDRAQWRMSVPHYGRVAARQVYPGIDVVWYAQGRLLEYDFVVAPGADPGAIRVRVDGGKTARLDGSGDLVYEVGGVEVRKHRPVVYQTDAQGERKPVEAGYRLLADGSVGFRVGGYDRSRALVIDPLFSYAGFVGGTRLDVARAVVVDPADGGLWVAGSSQSDLSLPEETVTVQRKFGGSVDAFLAKIMPAAQGGGEVVYWTYFGGSGNDEATAMSIGPDGAFVLTGNTNSLDFPPAGNSWRVDNPQLDVEAFVIRFDPRIEGDLAMTYSSYFGGSGREFPQAVAADGLGRIVIAGYSNSGELPKGDATGLQRSNRGGQDIFFALFDVYAPTAEQTLVKSSFLGGDSTDIANFAAFDAQGRIVLAGVTMSSDFPLAGPSYQSERQGFSSGFIAVIDPARSGLDQLIYATYLGGAGLDAVTAGSLDPQGRLWLTGYTSSSNLPVTPGAAQPFRAGVMDAFLMIVDTSQAGADFLKYGTFFGASNAEVPYALAVNPATGLAIIGGYSSSNDFPVKDTPVLPPPSVRVFEAFFAGIDTTVAGPGGIRFASQYGGKGRDITYGIAFGPDGAIALAGSTTSDDLPTASPSGKLNGLGLETGWYLRLLP